MNNLWNDNKNSLYEFIWQSHVGIKGFVKDNTKQAISNALIKVSYESTNDHKYYLIEHDVKTTLDGEYWRLLMPGNYEIWAEKDSLRSRKQRIKLLRMSPYTEAFLFNFTVY